MQAEIDMSIRTQRLFREWDGITKKLSKQDFIDLTGLMFLGDAQATVFTDHELEQADTSPAVRTAYRKTRRFLDKLGRFSEQHNRAMALAVLQRRTTLVRKMAAARGVDIAEFRSLYDKRAKLLAEQRAGRSNPDHLDGAIALATEALHGPGPWAEDYREWAEETDRLQPRIDDIRVRRRTGYVPHKFTGRWRIYQEVSTDESPVHLGFEEKPFSSRKAAEAAAQAMGGGVAVEVDGGWGFRGKWKDVAAETGVWQTRTDAIQAASHLGRENPDAVYRVMLQQFVFPEAQATTLSDAAYFRFLGNVNELLGLQGDALREAVAGVARRRFRRRIPDFSLYREGLEGFDRNLDRVIRTHIGQTVRYVSLDRLKFDAINLMEREGLSPNRSAIQDRPVLAAALNQWFKDVNGQKQIMESQVDELLAKPWVTPLRGGLVAGTVAFLAAGGPANAPISPIVAAYVGWNVGRGLSRGGSFASRSITGSMLGQMSQAKLGMLNLMSAVVNTTQTVLNTAPVLGPRDTAVGIKRLNKAVLSKLRGKTQLRLAAARTPRHQPPPEFRRGHPSPESRRRAGGAVEAQHGVFHLGGDLQSRRGVPGRSQQGAARGQISRRRDQVRRRRDAAHPVPLRVGCQTGTPAERLPPRARPVQELRRPAARVHGRPQPKGVAFVPAPRWRWWPARSASPAST